MKQDIGRALWIHADDAKSHSSVYQFSKHTDAKKKFNISGRPNKSRAERGANHWILDIYDGRVWGEIAQDNLILNVVVLILNSWSKRIRKTGIVDASFFKGIREILHGFVVLDSLWIYRFFCAKFTWILNTINHQQSSHNQCIKKQQASSIMSSPSSNLRAISGMWSIWPLWLRPSGHSNYRYREKQHLIQPRRRCRCCRSAVGHETDGRRRPFLAFFSLPVRTSKNSLGLLTVYYVHTQTVGPSSFREVRGCFFLYFWNGERFDKVTWRTMISLE